MNVIYSNSSRIFLLLLSAVVFFTALVSPADAQGLTQCGNGICNTTSGENPFTCKADCSTACTNDCDKTKNPYCQVCKSEPTPSPTTVCPLKNKGDANCDTKIDLLDFNLWRGAFLTTSSKATDFNNDTASDLIDFNIWRDGFLQKPLDCQPKPPCVGNFPACDIPEPPNTKWCAQPTSIPPTPMPESGPGEECGGTAPDARQCINGFRCLKLSFMPQVKGTCYPVPANTPSPAGPGEACGGTAPGAKLCMNGYTCYSNNPADPDGLTGGKCIIQENMYPPDRPT